MKEIISETLILDRISIHAQGLTQKTPEKLRVPFTVEVDVVATTLTRARTALAAARPDDWRGHRELCDAR